jgi:hypothetical protein
VSLFVLCGGVRGESGLEIKFSAGFFFHLAAAVRLAVPCRVREEVAA